ncbi:MAG: hypothetical protein KGM44_05200 [bacterium]|nr:hypothetical protein [bacterium]
METTSTILPRAGVGIGDGVGVGVGAGVGVGVGEGVGEGDGDGVASAIAGDGAGVALVADVPRLCAQALNNTNAGTKRSPSMRELGMTDGLCAAKGGRPSFMRQCLPH